LFPTFQQAAEGIYTRKTPTYNLLKFNLMMLYIGMAVTTRFINLVFEASAFQNFSIFNRPTMVQISSVILPTGIEISVNNFLLYCQQSVITAAIECLNESTDWR
jgi:hypothetical protein